VGKDDDRLFDGSRIVRPHRDSQAGNPNCALVCVDSGAAQEQRQEDSWESNEGCSGHHAICRRILDLKLVA
jgi:hypothetical protein